MSQLSLQTVVDSSSIIERATRAHAGLDPIGAAEFRELLINRLSKEEGKTIILSTHNLEETQSLCDRIAILQQGKILACDAPEAIRYLRIERARS